MIVGLFKTELIVLAPKLYCGNFFWLIGFCFEGDKPNEMVTLDDQSNIRVKGPFKKYVTHFCVSDTPPLGPPLWHFPFFWVTDFNEHNLLWTL